MTGSSVEAAMADDCPMAGHGGASVAVRKVSSRNLKTTVSKGPRPEHGSRSTDAPALHKVLQLRKRSQREVTTWRLDGSVYPSAAKLLG